MTDNYVMLHHTSYNTGSKVLLKFGNYALEFNFLNNVSRAPIVSAN